MIFTQAMWDLQDEETQQALERLLAEIQDSGLSEALVIVDRAIIRIILGKQRVR